MRIPDIELQNISRYRGELMGAASPKIPNIPHK